MTTRFAEWQLVPALQLQQTHIAAEMSHAKTGLRSIHYISYVGTARSVGSMDVRGDDAVYG